MPSPLPRIYRYCRGDGSLTLAVLILIVFVFVLYPLVELGVLPRLWLDVAFATCITLGAMFVYEPRPIMRWFLGFLVLALLARIVDVFVASTLLTASTYVLAIAACLLLAALLLVRAMRDGRINVNRIMGALGSYLLIGIIFGQAYRLLALLAPGAFALAGVPATFERIESRLTYYSFVTLTSTGYGDITPLHPFARSLSVLEALSGGLFLTVLVARLVGLEMQWREEQRALRHEHARRQAPG